MKQTQVNLIASRGNVYFSQNNFIIGCAALLRVNSISIDKQTVSS